MISLKESILSSTRTGKKAFMPVLGGVYKGVYKNELWKIVSYCSLDNKIKSSNVKNIKELIKKYDDTGSAQELLNEYGEELKKDTIFVACSLVKGSHDYAVFNVVFLWGDEISNEDLIKK